MTSKITPERLHAFSERLDKALESKEFRDGTLVLRFALGLWIIRKAVRGSKGAMTYLFVAEMINSEVVGYAIDRLSKQLDKQKPPTPPEVEQQFAAAIERIKAAAQAARAKRDALSDG